jgi:hypothetical protein
MITREDIIQIYENRDKRLFDWVESKPEKKTITALKKDMKIWHKEISDAQKLAKENDPLFPKDGLESIYTSMNISSAIFANYVVRVHYIKKLENELKLETKKKPKNLQI